MADVELVPETGSTITLYSVRVDQRTTTNPIEVDRPGKEKPRLRPGRSIRIPLILITGKATQTEKDDLEAVERTWWGLGTGATKGRVRFKWGNNKGDGSIAGSYYNCALRKIDFTEEAAHAKYDYIIELIEGEFT